ncbi:MAG TPA: zinc-binding alcohol dehydrogenase family protein [Trebonia sp.]|jgi:NADPH2:quinone reductase|nr:zinc-binding alcohol dehydrogenase family protein [Trebonia sp.]
MTQMAAVITADGQLTDASVPVPDPGPRDLLVRVAAVSVNPVDTKVRPGRAGRILGYDAAGTVVAAGPEVTRFAVGDEVYYAGDITRPGSNAEFQAVDERITGRKPSSLSFADAAALPLTTITAWETLFDHLRATPESAGDFLIVGAPGGVGSILTQLARTQTRLRVIGTAGRTESAAWVREMGAHETVDRHDLAAEVRRVAPGGVDWLFTSYSRGQIPVYAEVLRPFGHIVAIDDEHEDSYPLKSKSLTWHWEFMFARSSHQAGDLGVQGALLDRVAALVDKGVLRTTATRRMAGITAATLAEAHRLAESGGVIGKIVLSR